MSEVSYAKAVSDAWNEFCAKHDINEKNEPIGNAFMAGWIQGLGSLNEDR